VVQTTLTFSYELNLDSDIRTVVEKAESPNGNGSKGSVAGLDSQTAGKVLACRPLAAIIVFLSFR